MKKLAALAVCVLALSGCAPSVATVPGPTLALQAEAAMTAQKITVSVTCGEDDLDLVAGTVVDCSATDPSDGTVYSAAVTITTVTGGTYTIDVEIGDVVTAPTSAPAPSVTAEAFATAAAGALAPRLGYTPVVDCLDQDIKVYIDAVYQCVATDENGVDFAATVTVTSVDGSSYEIGVEIDQQPLG